MKGLGFLADTAEGAGPLHFLVPNPGLLGRWPMWIKQLARITPPPAKVLAGSWHALGFVVA